MGENKNDDSFYQDKGRFCGMKFLRRSELNWKLMGEEVVILDRHEGKVYRLNPCASRIWEMLDGERTLEEITDQITARYDASREKIRKDVSKFIKDFYRNDMILEKK